MVLLCVHLRTKYPDSSLNIVEIQLLPIETLRLILDIAYDRRSKFSSLLVLWFKHNLYCGATAYLLVGKV